MPWMEVTRDKTKVKKTVELTELIINQKMKQVPNSNPTESKTTKMAEKGKRSIHFVIPVDACTL